MGNPWDTPPLPKVGDYDIALTFAAVGRVLSMWELAEFTLSRIYSAFNGTPDGIAELQEYGAGRIFRDRLDSLRRSADQVFRWLPNQELEGEFHRIETYMTGFCRSAKRYRSRHGP